jgi:hypothetical protein
VCQFKSVPQKDRWHWKYRKVNLKTIPVWCPLNV